MMSDYDEFDEIFHRLQRYGEPSSTEDAIGDDAFRGIPQLEDAESALDDELIIGDDTITFLLFAKGNALGDFSVITREHALEVKTRKFSVKKELRFRVDAERPWTTYKNGVLSVKLKRLR